MLPTASNRLARSLRSGFFSDDAFLHAIGDLPLARVTSVIGVLPRILPCTRDKNSAVHTADFLSRNGRMAICVCSSICAVLVASLPGWRGFQSPRVSRGRGI